MGRLAVRTVVGWSCYVTTKMCPIEGCQEEETLEHFLLECQRSREVWRRITQIGLDVDINYKSVKYGIFKEKLSVQVKELYWQIICTVVSKLWKTRCVGILEQKTITSETVFKQIRRDLKRKRTADIRAKITTPWHIVNL